jgi:tRNA C32,U32 (ribose-2'-O)-methylase TrmJ
MAQTATAQRTGTVVQVIGPVIDIEFSTGLPEIYNAVRIVSEGGPGIEKIDVVAEVEQHLGENRVRAVAMKPTDGMTRGMAVIDTGATPLPQASFEPDDTLLLGRESAGVPAEVHAAADLRVRVPLQKGARSLNVALAAAMVLSEALRQTSGFPAPA